MSSPSHNLVADAFVAGSLQQAVFALNGSYGIIDGPEAEPRAARTNDIHLFRHAAFEIRPAHPEGLPVSIDALKRLLQEEMDFFQGLDGLLLGMDPDISSGTRSRCIARADRILDSDSAVTFRIRKRFLSPADRQEWDPRGALKLAEAQGAIQAATCYRALADGAVDRIVDDIAAVVSEQYGTGAEAAENRDRVLRSGLVADLVRIEVECDRKAATNLAFRAGDYPDLGALIRTRHMLAVLGKLMLRRLASPSPVRSVEGSGVADVTEQIDPIIATAEAVADSSSGSRRGDKPAKAFDLTAIQSQIAWIGDQLSSGEIGRAEQAIVRLVRRQAERSRPSDVVKTLTAVADLARGKGYGELTWRVLSAIDFVGHTDAAAQSVRASLLSDEGRLDEALSVLDEAIERFPDDVVARNARAETLRAMGRTDEALDALDQTIERFPDNVVARTARAETLRAMGRTDEALDALDQTIERFPDNVVARTARAETLRAMGRMDEALDALDQTIERFPDNVVARNTYAHHLALRGKFDRAMAILNSAAAQPKTRDDWVAKHILAMAWLRTGHFDEAYASLDEGARRCPFPDAQIYFRTARPIARLAARQAREAIEEFKALETDTTLSGAQATNVVLLQAHAFAEIGDREHARQLIDQTTTVIDFEAARQKLAGALRQRYGLSEGEAASGELADRLDEEITELEIDLESPLRLAA